MRLLLCGGDEWGGAVAGGEHPGFGRQQTQMNECGKAKLSWKEDNKGTLKKQECVVGAAFFL